MPIPRGDPHVSKNILLPWEPLRGKGFFYIYATFTLAYALRRWA